jgi:hypothetical protein
MRLTSALKLSASLLFTLFVLGALVVYTSSHIAADSEVHLRTP